jgi:nucleoside-triphosphatase THEP1
VRKKELVAISKLLIDNLVTTNSFQVHKLWDFEVYKIREGGTYRMFVDDKNRNLLIQDFVFQFIN